MFDKLRYTNDLGVVADFCPVCREVCAFRLLRISLKYSVYMIPLGNGETVKHVKKCCKCEFSFMADIRCYQKPVEEFSGDLEGLVASTFPDLHEVYARRFQMEETYRDSPALLTREERLDLMLELFVKLDSTVDEFFNHQVHLGRGAKIALCVSLFILVAGTTIAVNQRYPAMEETAIVTLILFGIGIGYTIVRAVLARMYFMRDKIAPVIARAIYPLKPTYEELSEYLAYCKSVGMPIGKKLKQEHLRVALENAERELG